MGTEMVMVESWLIVFLLKDPEGICFQILDWRIHETTKQGHRNVGRETDQHHDSLSITANRGSHIYPVFYSRLSFKSQFLTFTLVTLKMSDFNLVWITSRWLAASGCYGDLVTKMQLSLSVIYFYFFQSLWKQKCGSCWSKRKSSKSG